MTTLATQVQQAAARMNKLRRAEKVIEFMEKNSASAKLLVGPENYNEALNSLRALRLSMLKDQAAFVNGMD